MIGSTTRQTCHCNDLLLQLRRTVSNWLQLDLPPARGNWNRGPWLNIFPSTHYLRLKLKDISAWLRIKVPLNHQQIQRVCFKIWPPHPLPITSNAFQRLQMDNGHRGSRQTQVPTQSDKEKSQIPMSINTATDQKKLLLWFNCLCDCGWHFHWNCTAKRQQKSPEGSQDDDQDDRVSPCIPCTSLLQPPSSHVVSLLPLWCVYLDLWLN